MDTTQVVKRLQHLLDRCSRRDDWSDVAVKLSTWYGDTSLESLTDTIVTAWAKIGRLPELEKAMEEETWLMKEVGKVVSKMAEKKKRPREEGSELTKLTYGARHLLIKFDKSRNPVSKRTGESTAGVSADAAAAELAQIREQIVAEGGTQDVFARHASQRSDCSSFKRGGDLGTFVSGKMQKAFEEGTRACSVGGMSAAVLSDSGYHLIWRYQ